jgi:hypothetical protein
LSGRKNHVREINAVLTLATADRLLMHDHGRPRTGPSASTIRASADNSAVATL